MRLGTKLLAGFFSISLLVLITGSLSYYLGSAVKDELIETSELTSSQLQTLTDMTSDLQSSLLYTRNYLTELDKRNRGDNSISVTAQIRESRRVVERSLDNFEADFRIFLERSKRNIAAEEDFDSFVMQIEQLADSLQTSFNYYNSLTRQIIEPDETGFGNEIFVVTVEPYFRNTLLPSLMELRSLFNERVNNQLAELESRANTTVRQVILITILSFFIALVFAMIVYRSIAKPIQKLQRTADELGSGDLSKRIEIQTRDELADLADSFNSMAENLSKSMVSRGYMNNIIQSMGDMLIVTDDDHKIELLNHAVETAMGYHANHLEGVDINKLFDDKKVGEFMEVYSDNDTGEPIIGEWMMKTGKDEEIPVVVTHTKIEDQNGETKHIYVVKDITEQKEAARKISDSLKEKEVMLSEIHHRVKNNLAVISGLLEMQVWNTDNEVIAESLRDSQLKIKSMSLVHEKLYQNENFVDIDIAAYTEELVSEIQRSFQTSKKKIEVSFDCRSILVTLNQAIPISLLLNESVVNIYKHAFKKRRSGEIFIKMRQKDDKVGILIADNGVGFPEGFQPGETGTMGMLLIETLVKQLNAEYRFRNGAKSGTELVIVFPLNEKAGGSFV
ncbi:histidine kinase dimerization/phosphoacceptor domain -containing protein [Rhodohalobacter halophilus]|uniref:histidine kinase dimerization/phosphoacceptor domain -containing protein n=1 Tax=Rhodohalobacter halophilus TaxID=1812810 RepID=UPI00083FD2D4|nr:histidine kinase dimerization/phosphoacceptor domain -containing protein [Rhodohalobacter halophilus]